MTKGSKAVSDRLSPKVRGAAFAKLALAAVAFGLAQRFLLRPSPDWSTFVNGFGVAMLIGLTPWLHIAATGKPTPWIWRRR